MGLFVNLGAYLKETRVVKALLRGFEYLYIRWRVIRSTSTEFDQEDDSHDSSYYEAQRKRIVRTTSLYNNNCPTSMREGSFSQKPTCMEIYRQFMNYGALESAVPGHIYLSHSASYYATSGVSLCQLSFSESDSEIDETASQPEVEESRDAELQPEVTYTVEEEDETCRLYENWISKHNKNSSQPRRMLPITPVEDPLTAKIEGDIKKWSFDYYQTVNSARFETVTYPEEQRQTRNYFFTKPMFFENNELRIQEEKRKMEEERFTNPPIIAKKLSEHSYENDFLRRVAGEIEQRRIQYENMGYSCNNQESCSVLSELASTALPGSSDTSSLTYQTPSISSPIAKEISERFSKYYWNVENHNDDGAIGARDNYHNRFFGKAGYYLTRNAIKNQANDADTMPAVERRALQVERKRWTDINQLGGRYENVELGLPDTNGISTNHWDDEYEQPLPLHTCDVWRTPKRYTPKYTSLF